MSIAPPGLGRAAGTRTTSSDEAESTGLRLTFLTLLVVSLLVLLFARLWFLQVMAGERYASLAHGNAVRTITVEPGRGKLLDRDGETIVRNRSALVVSVQPREMGDRRDEVLADLADLLGMDLADIERRIEDSRVSPFRPKPIAIDVPEPIVDYIHANASRRYPGVYPEILPLRDYPHGDLATHVVGYVGEISAEQLERPEFEDYRPGEIVGWAGVEQTYQHVLRGEHGVRQLEVDARGRVLRELEETLPVPGSDVRLTLDLQAQQIAESALEKGMERAREARDDDAKPYQAPAGAAVVLDPSTGEVLAMVSRPTFEPGRFVGGVSQDYWGWLQNAENHYPLINRAIQSSYAPGSVFKIISAGTALEEGFMSPGSQLPCPGSWEWAGRIFHNWRRANSGSLNLREALTQSCDTVFYELARRMWQHEQATGADREFLTDHMRAWGVGEPLGIDLPSERGGVAPGRDWKRRYWEEHKDTYCRKAETLPPGRARDINADLCKSGHKWRGGDAVNMSIGQGDMQMTPLQVATAYAAVANGGTLYRPHVVSEIVHRDGRAEQTQPEAIGTVPVSPSHLDYIEQGLVGVTNAGGTAGGAFKDFPLAVAGKTGTAQVYGKQDFAWFAAYAPVASPRYVVVAMVEQGGGGSRTAAPVVRQILEGLLVGPPQDADGTPPDARTAAAGTQGPGTEGPGTQGVSTPDPGTPDTDGGGTDARGTSG